MHGPAADGEEGLRRPVRVGTDPDLRAWLERERRTVPGNCRPGRSKKVLRFQESAAAVGSVGVERFVELLEPAAGWSSG